MAFDNSFTAVVGATYTAAQYNTHVRDNFTAVWVYTAAGDIAYATSATALARLAKPSVDSVLKNTSAGALSWLALSTFPGRFHATGSDFSDSLISTTNTSYEYTGIAFNFILSATCTVFAIATGAASKDLGTHNGFINISIDGTIQTDQPAVVKSTGLMSWTAFYIKTGVPAGARNVSLYYKTANASDEIGLDRALIAALAFVE